MYRALINKFLPSPVLYVQISEDRLKILNIHSRKRYDEKPLLAIEVKEPKTVVAAGNAAELLRNKPNVSVLNPFAHPRTLISNFQVAEKLLQHAFKLVLTGRLIQPAPKVVLHPLSKLEGGITEIETKAFMELSYSAGAQITVVYNGPVLSGSRLDFDQIQASHGERI